MLGVDMGAYNSEDHAQVITPAWTNGIQELVSME
jgi:hypothetical protein